MKIEEVRTSFTVYVIASDLARLDGVAESLGLAGYMVASFAELTSAFSEFYSNPPHFLLFDAREKKFNLEKAIQQVIAQLPESHVFLVTPVEEREKAIPHLEAGVYDLILTPILSPTELVRTIDRAAERDYFMYMNERLLQTQEAQVTTGPVAPMVHDGGSDTENGFATQLFAPNSIDECIQVFLKNISGLLENCSAVYFKYIPNRRVLLAGQSERLNDFDLGSLGMNLNDVSPGFRATQLREPLKLGAFTEMVREVFSVEDFVAWPVEALGEVLGIVCFLVSPSVAELQMSRVGDRLGLLGKALGLIQAEKRLHVVSSKDAHTDVLNRQTFLTKVSEEISRARRTQLPISLVTMAVDQYGQLSAHFEQDEAQLILRMAARILEKQSRVNDIVGRTGVDEFGLLLPNTDKKGAMLKAERLRRTIESADFSKVLSQFPRFTVSLGVSEYPSLVRDAEELLQSADEALFQVRQVGNRTCVAKAPADLEPDFQVEETEP